MIKNNFPQHLEIETTNHCQLSCVFCPHKIMKREKGFMSLDTLNKIIDEAKGKTKTCYLHQIGEPLLHPNISKIVRFVKKAGIYTSLSTNAIKLDSVKFICLSGSGLDELTLAIDAFTPKTYEKLRGNASSFNVIVDNIDNCLNDAYFDFVKLKRHIPRIEIQVIVTKENESEIPDIVKKYKGMIDQLDNGSWIRIKPFSTFAGRVDDISPNETQPLRYKCSKLKTHLAIHWNGDMSLCCRDYDGEQIIGNIHKNTIEEVWNGEYMNKLQKAHKEKDWDSYPELGLCKNC